MRLLTKVLQVESTSLAVLRLVILLGFGLLAPPLADAAIIGTTTFQGHTYDFLSRQSWQSAEAEAISLGGHLVTINDQAENDFVRAFASQQYSTTPPDFQGFWIGLNDLAVEGQFVWADGSNSLFRNWQLGEPNNLNNQDFVLMYFGNGQWDDDNQVTSGQFDGAVVEIASAVPEPSSLTIMGIGIACAAGGRRIRSKRVGYASA